MKKIISILTASLMIMALLTGCGDKNGESSGSDGSSSLDPSTKTVKVGIVQISDHPSLNSAKDAIIKTLTEKYGDNLVIDDQNAFNEVSRLPQICSKFVGDEVDLIVAIGTSSAQAAAVATSDIPIVYTAVSDPGAAELVNIPNVAGMSDAIPIEALFEFAAQLTPNAKKFGFIYNTGEINSVATVNLAKTYCDANGIEYEEKVVTNAAEVQQAVEALAGKVDAIFTPTDNTVATSMKALSNIAIKHKIPVYPGAEEMVKDGGLATVGVNYYDLGLETAKMVLNILDGGDAAAEGHKTLPEFSKVVNEETAKAIGVEIPEDALKD